MGAEVREVRYGVPRQGSKNGIAKWVVEILPSDEVLVDLFCGGCAITHCAMLRGKWEKFIINDIEKRCIDLFLDSIAGKYTVDKCKEWVSHDEFNARKATDGYIAAVWSFGNNYVNYIYGKTDEEKKHALHDYAFFADNTRFEAQGIKTPQPNKEQTIEERAKAICAYFRERLRPCEILQSLQSFSQDYTEIKIPNNAVVYCDIPYLGTDSKSYNGFDHARFYKWAIERDDVFISEYTMPSPFVPIAAREKVVLSDKATNSKHATEYIFTTPNTLARYKGRYTPITAPYSEQISMFMEEE